MNGSDLKKLCTEARPIIERMLDDAEVLAGFREAATAKGIDWSQVKALLKAQIQDERDGKDRVKAIVEKAEVACAYADLLKMNENNFSSPTTASVTTASATSHLPKDAQVTLTVDPFDIPPELKRKRA